VHACNRSGGRLRRLGRPGNECETDAEQRDDRGADSAARDGRGRFLEHGDSLPEWMAEAEVAAQWRCLGQQLRVKQRLAVAAARLRVPGEYGRVAGEFLVLAETRRG